MNAADTGTLPPPNANVICRLNHRASLAVEVVHVEDSALAALKGEVGFQQVDILQLHLNRLLAMRLSVVVLDLAELRYIGSLALGVLVEFRRALLRSGGRLRLRGLRSLVAHIFRRARLDDLFGIREGEEQETGVYALQ